jgi:hypothetical protein
MIAKLWILGTSAVWLVFFVADLRETLITHSDGTLMHISQITAIAAGMLAEVRGARWAWTVNVGYYILWGSWTIGRAFFFSSRGLTPAGEAAIIIDFMGIPMLLIGIMNAVIYALRSANRPANGVKPTTGPRK